MKEREWYPAVADQGEKVPQLACDKSAVGKFARGVGTGAAGRWQGSADSSRAPLDGTEETTGLDCATPPLGGRSQSAVVGIEISAAIREVVLDRAAQIAGA